MHSKLMELGIIANKTGMYLCPKCSHTRKKSNVKCLGVKFKDDCVLYNCVHCGFKGIVSDRRYNLEVKPKIYIKPKPPKIIDDKECVYNWFATRGLNRETVDAHKIGYNGREIIFPFYRNNELVNCKYRTHDKKFRQEAGTESILFGIDTIIDMVAENDTNVLVYTEGETDSMSFYQAGIPAVSIPQGASDKKLEFISNCYDFVDAFKSVVIAVDADKAGNVIKQALIERFSKSKNVYIIDWSKYDVKDANEALQRGGEELIQKAYAEKESIPIKGIIDMRQHEENIMDYMFGDQQKGASTGWSNLDKMLRMQGGCLMTITGYPSRGKSTVTNNLLYNLTEQSNWKHLICSFENTVARHVQEFTELRTGKNSRTEGTWKLKKEEALESITYLSDKFYLYDTDVPLTVDDIIEIAKYAVERYGIKTLTIDPYNRIKHPSSDREDKYIGEMLSKLSFFAKQYDVLVIFVAHPKKPPQGHVDAPTAYDISGSSDWYNMSDIVICVHRPREEGGKLSHLTELYVQKVKGHHLGDPAGGMVNLQMHANRLVIA